MSSSFSELNNETDFKAQGKILIIKNIPKTERMVQRAEIKGGSFEI